MKKNKFTKAKTKKITRIFIILFLLLGITIFCYKKKEYSNNKILEANARDSFVNQSIMLANDLKNEYTDIESLENDDISFVSDAAIKTGKSQYYIRVNYGANCVNIYTKDDEKNYTVPYKSMICSTGISTPKSGTYQITYKYRWLRLFGDVYGQYSTRIVKNILFHSVPYFKQRADTLEYEEYDKLGTKASAGCIRLTVEDSKWIYDNIPSGTYVEFYSDPDNPGPLGKPKAQKISDNEECRNWDPTDPDKNNPWNGGSGIPSVTYTYTDNNKSTNKKTNTNSNNTNINNNSTTKNTTNTLNTNNTNQTNTSVNNNKDENSKENNKVTTNNTNNKPSQSNTVKNEVSTNSTNTTTSTNTSIEKPETNTSTTPNTNTTTNNSNKVEDNTKPIEKPNTNTTKPDITTPSKPDDNQNQEKPQEPEKPVTSTSPTTTPEASTNTSV